MCICAIYHTYLICTSKLQSRYPFWLVHFVVSLPHASTCPFPCPFPSLNRCAFRPICQSTCPQVLPNLISSFSISLPAPLCPLLLALFLFMFPLPFLHHSLLSLLVCPYVPFRFLSLYFVVSIFLFVLDLPPLTLTCLLSICRSQSVPLPPFVPPFISHFRSHPVHLDFVGGFLFPSPCP